MKFLFSILCLLALVTSAISSGVYDSGVYDSTIASAGWLELDLGAVGGTGTRSHSSGTFTSSDRGAQVWGRADSGGYIYKHGASAGAISARVASMSATDAQAQACVAIRETLLPDSKSLTLCATKSRGLQWIVRRYNQAPDESATVTQFGGASVPVYLRITRSGDDFTAEYSNNGSTWVQVGSTARVYMLPIGFTFGLLTSSHNTGSAQAATFDNLVETFTDDGAHYYISATAPGGGNGSFSSPWTLKEALVTNVATPAAGSRLWLRRGRYLAKVATSLQGSSSAQTWLREYPGERATIDGGWFTTTTSSIASSGCGFTVASTEWLLAGVLSNTVHVISTASDGTQKREDILVTGLSGNTVTNCARGWNGTPASAHNPGARIILPGSTLTFNGAYIDAWDFEVQNSEPNRVGSGYPYGGDGDSQNWPALRGPGISVNAQSIRTLFSVVHDNSDGISAFNGAIGHVMHGAILYNNGTGVGAVNNRPNGHGIYIQNQAGTPRYYQYSISTNNFATCYKYGAVTGWVQDLTAQYLIGQFGGIQGARGERVRSNQPVLEIAPDSTPAVRITVDNLSAYAWPYGGDVTLLFGYTAANNKQGVLTNNYLSSGGQGFDVRNWQSVTVSNNLVYLTNGDGSADTGMGSVRYSTQGGYSGVVDRVGTSVTRVSGDPFNHSWGTGCTGCTSTINIGGTNFTIASVNDAGTAMTLTAGTGSQIGASFLVSASTESHPLSGQVSVSNNTYYSGGRIEGTTPQTNLTRDTYHFNLAEPGRTFANELGGGRLQFNVAGANNDWRDGLTTMGISGADASPSSWQLGKPSGTVVRFNALTAFHSGRGYVALAAVYNWGDASTITISSTDLGTVFSVGDRIEIYKGENPHGCGAPIYSGTYAGSSLTLSTSDRTVCQAIENPFVPPSAFPRFVGLIFRRL